MTRPTVKATSAFVALFAVFLCMTAAGEDNAAWRRITGDFTGYVELGLPMEFTVYAFTASGNLAGFTTANWSKRYAPKDAPLHKIIDAIQRGDFTGLRTTQLGVTEKLLQRYMHEQGYQWSNIIRKGTRYSLLLVVNGSPDKSCAELRQFQRRYINAIHQAVAQATIQGGYSVSILELRTPLVITCAANNSDAGKLIQRMKNEAKRTHATPVPSI